LEDWLTEVFQGIIGMIFTTIHLVDRGIEMRIISVFLLLVFMGCREEMDLVEYLSTTSSYTEVLNQKLEDVYKYSFLSKLENASTSLLVHYHEELNRSLLILLNGNELLDFKIVEGRSLPFNPAYFESNLGMGLIINRTLFLNRVGDEMIQEIQGVYPADVFITQEFIFTQPQVDVNQV
jgi:hypothetical protein